MQLSQSKPRRILLIFLASFIAFSMISVFGQAAPSPQLGVMQTAETIGKGGYTTAFGLFQFETGRLDPDQRQRVVIGNFEESHLVEFEVDTFLVPIRFTYGIGERLDLILGGTFSTGGIRKIIPDFYRLGDRDKDDPPLDPSQDRRVYDQALFDVVVGLKHNIKPDEGDGLPSISVGGEVQIGFTADNRLGSVREFIDASPDDSFPFVGVNTYFVGTQRLGEIIRLHAGLGIYLSSKSLKATDSFISNWQLGGELAFSENLWVEADFSRELPLSGVTISNLLSVGLRYELTESAAFHVGYVSQPGFQFYLTVGGEREGGVFPESPEKGEDLLF